jgi:hypothetical protein
VTTFMFRENKFHEKTKRKVAWLPYRLPGINVIEQAERTMVLDRESYSENGYLLAPGLLADTAVDSLVREQARFARPDAPLAVEVQLVHRSSVIRDLAQSGPQVALAVELLGPNVCFTHQQFVSKGPDAGDASDVPWHQDSGYGHLDPPSDLTVWIALSYTDEENGCLWVLPGSHRDGLKAHDPVGGLRGADVQEQGLAVPMRRGDVLLFGGLLMHRSLPNRTDTARHAMYLRYCTPDVRMMSPDGKDGTPVLEDEFSWMVAGEAAG